MARAGDDARLADLKKEIERIDRGIAELLEVEDAAKIVDLKFTRNSFVPIHQLPNELLSEIFLSCADLEWIGSMLPSYCLIDLIDEPPWGWIFITHVCQRWRMVALDIATLWTSLNLGYPDWAVEMLKRSRSAPLRIQYSARGVGSKGLQVLEQVLADDIARVLTLALSYGKEDEIQRLLLTLGPAPLLEKLHLEAYASGRSITNGPFLPACFPGHTIPKLTHLSIVNLHVPWTDPFFDTVSCLTSLRISSKCRSQIPLEAELLSLLQKLPSLRELDLQKALRRPTIGHSSIQCVNLSKLQYLGVSSTTIPKFIGFLDRIRFPISTIVHFQESAFSSSEHCIEELLLLARTFARLLKLSRPHRRRRPEGIRSLVLNNDFYFSFKAWIHGVDDVGPVDESPDTPWPQKMVDPPRVSWDHGWNPEATSLNVDDILAGLLPSLRLRDLESLSVALYEHDFQITGTTFSTFFASLKSLDEITVTDDEVAREFFPTLREAVKGTLAYPDLTWLDITSVDFRADPSLFTSFLDACEYRRERGFTIPNISLQDCNISTEQDAMTRNRLTEENLEVVNDPRWDWGNPDEE
ncbi:hypothetical protein VNI00_004753 [Paramarasmius palmivorus]|uniref:F-box domain-containing protein n=1 Tax=Paramarasmius palmivorus TaxID=297713 RepID=A0AAW0DHE7_9AGAR